MLSGVQVNSEQGGLESLVTSTESLTDVCT